MIKKYTDFVSHNTPCPYCLGIYLDGLKVNNAVLENRSNVVRSMSIVVPTKGCVNDCKFCVSKLSDTSIYSDLSKEEQFEEFYFQKLEQVSKMNCDDAILTGDGEPLQNKPFLEMIGRLNKKLEKPFRLEIQTSGALLNDANLDFLKNVVGVNLISLSVSNIFDDVSNVEIIGMKPKLRFKIVDLCHKIKSKGFMLRISLNLISVYNKFKPKDVIEKLQETKTDQATFRILWAGKENNQISNWIRNNKVAQKFVDELIEYCSDNGKRISTQLYMFQIGNMSVVIDDDCMSEQESEVIRYLILRSDCNIYTKWDSKASLFA